MYIYLWINVRVDLGNVVYDTLALDIHMHMYYME